MIIIKLKKGFNLKIIAVSISIIFLLCNTLYSYTDALRIPAGQKDTFDRIRQSLQEESGGPQNSSTRQIAPKSARYSRIFNYGVIGLYSIMLLMTPIAKSLSMPNLNKPEVNITVDTPIDTRNNNYIDKRMSQGDFSPAQVAASVAGPGFGYDNIIEQSPDKNRLIQVLTDLTNIGENKKVVHWRWSKPGESWTSKKWDSDTETIDLSGNIDDLVFRFVISGTPNAEYKVIFEDSQGQRINVLSTEYLTTLHAEQYWLVKLDENLRNRNPAFNWRVVKPPVFEGVTTQAKVYLKSIKILNVKDIREKGISIGFFLDPGDGSGNNFPPLTGYTGKVISGGRVPASVLSFSSLLHRDPYQMLKLWNKLFSGQVPHEVLEIWLPEKSLGKININGIRDDEYVNNLRKTAAEKKARILGGEKEGIKLLKISAGASVFKRVINGEVDDYFVKRALAAKEYGKPIMMRVFHESEGGWYPWSIYSEQDIEDFIKSWKHIVKIYRENGATNVAFGLSPHTYEPDYLPQTRKFQILDLILWRLLNDANGPFVDFVGIDTYSYPPQGGYFNELVTECLETVGKYGIPIIMGETSSAMSMNDKYKFWNYKRTDLENGMFSNPRLSGTVIFSIAKEENGWKDFIPPSDVMEQWERDAFFGANTFRNLPGRGHDKKEGILEPVLPKTQTKLGSWSYNGWNVQLFTALPGASGLEEWYCKRNNADFCGWGTDRIDGDWRLNLNNNSYSGYEFVMPMEILEGETYIIFEDSEMQSGVGNQIIISSNKLSGYIRDGQLKISLSEVIKIGTLDRGRFNWGKFMQIKFQGISQVSKMILGTPGIKYITNTAVEDDGSYDKESTGPAVILEQNYPNPFGANGTNIRYVINKPSQNVKIKIFDVLGRLIRVLNAERSIGTHIIKWDGLDEAGSPAASGLYIIEIVIDGKPFKTIKSIKLSAGPGLLWLGINEAKELQNDL